MSALALVVGLSGVNVAAAQSGATGNAGATGDVQAVQVGSSEVVEIIVDGESSAVDVRAVASVPLNLNADVKEGDGEDEDAEEVEEEEDGLRPTGQAEQRAQKIGERNETKGEDHDN